MGLTSSVPNSILQPGVCTSTTRPASPYSGQVIYETNTKRTLVWDTDAWIVVANASDTNFPASLDTNTVDSIAALQAKVGVDGSAVTSSLDYKVANQGLVLVKSQTVGTGVSSVSVTNVFSSTFDNYRIIFDGSGSAPSATLNLRFGAATSSYYGYSRRLEWNGAETNVNQSATTSLIIGAIGGAAGETGVSIDVYTPQQAIRTGLSGTGTGYLSLTLVGGVDAEFTAHTGFTIFPSTGTLNGRTIRVYGYNNG